MSGYARKNAFIWKRLARPKPRPNQACKSRDRLMTDRAVSQGIGGELVRNVGPTNDNGADGKVACRSRLGGMLNYYYREAA